VDIRCVKGHTGTPGNEKADKLAGKAAEKERSPITSMAFLKLRISEKTKAAKET
jgi:ribonuclease HI